MACWRRRVPMHWKTRNVRVGLSRVAATAPVMALVMDPAMGHAPGLAMARARARDVTLRPRVGRAPRVVPEKPSQQAKPARVVVPRVVPDQASLIYLA